MDCLYCEVGRTTLFTSERKDYLPLSALEEAIKRAKEIEDTFDVFTITGSGEPTLNLHFEKVVELAKQNLKKPLAILTNSTLVGVESVRQALALADYVLASLDSAQESSFRLVNRPVGEINLKIIIEGLKKLREEMRGELWLEIMLLKGLNDKEEDLTALKEAVAYIRPHRVQLNTVVRPPAYPMAKPLTWEELKDIKEKYLPEAEILPAQGKVQPSKFGPKQDWQEWLLAYLSRRPADLTELVQVFALPKEQLVHYLGQLESKGLIQRVEHEGKPFYRA